MPVFSDIQERRDGTVLGLLMPSR